MSNSFIKRLKFILFLFIFFIFSNCASQKTIQVFNDGYGDEKVFSTSLAVLPFTEEFVGKERWIKHLKFDSTNSNKLTYRTRNLFFLYYGNSIKAVSTASVFDLTNKNSMFKIKNSINTKSMNLRVDKNSTDSLSFLAPISGKLVINDDEPKYVLFLQTLHWDNAIQSTGSVIMGDQGTSVKVDINLKYLFWDNQDEKIASYGVLRKGKSLSGLPDNSTVQEIALELAYEMMEGSPIFQRDPFD